MAPLLRKKQYFLSALEPHQHPCDFEGSTRSESRGHGTWLSSKVVACQSYKHLERVLCSIPAGAPWL